MNFDEQTLIDGIVQQRWYGGKSRDVSHAQVVDSVLLRAADPQFLLALAELRYDTGAHDIYQLLLPEEETFGHARELVSAMRSGLTLQGSEGIVEFRPVPGFAGLGRELNDARDVGAEQSNSSVVFDDELILKAFRRLEPGINPELEMLRFLTARGFENVARLAGWYEYAGELLDATLGVVQDYVPGALDGFVLTLDELGSPAHVARLRELGRVIGRMHSVLASDANDPAFAPEEPSEESLSLLTATIDEEIERAFLELPDDPAVAEIEGRGEEVRDRLRMLSHVGARGKLIRHHGDLHLGQTLLAPDGTWIVLDFEGEPARPLLERRRKRSPLRDVAGMLRSLAYAASTSELQRGVPAPEGWEDDAREAFLSGYKEAVDPVLMPPSEGALRTLLSIFELEKAVYELRYELNNRPDWVRIPVAGIRRLLEEPL
jgi:maltokinase